MIENDDLQQRLFQWSEAFTASLQSQATFMDVLDEHLAVGFQTLMGAAITPGQLAVMRGAALNREDEAWRAEIAIDQHDVAEIVIESVRSRLLHAYEDYLLRHWQGRPKDLVDVSSYDKRIAQLLNAHVQQLGEFLDANTEIDVFLDLQAKWWKQQPMEVLPTSER
ncbi:MULTISPECIES: hypothetical protein [unclassified Pseudomonas]|uniref:hypothetical protein n=1 Tax=unclassified Pseudomonas TaxID=196821 RepID=UPI0004887D29|nr:MULTISPECIES: hypothetical protein [unclassified Pseudomonas]RAS27025.1 hypothetical protein H040_02633 [Pseudomonas sp. URMO17WK12:I7]SMF22202.1 hypothetical protein SAMN02745903_02147 [Pseudomonas sp. URMO17WK12:I5]